MSADGALEAHKVGLEMNGTRAERIFTAFGSRPSRVPGTRILFSVAATALAVMLAVLFVGQVTDHAARQERHDLTDVAVAAAGSLDPALVAQLRGAATDQGGATLASVRAQLARINQGFPHARFVYLMRWQHGRWTFLADAEPETSPDYSAPGDPYEDEGGVRGLNLVIATRQATVEGPYRDRWGYWVTGFAPVADPAGGPPLAVLGIDISATEYRHEIADYRAGAMVVAGVFGAGLALFAAFVWLMRRFNARLGAELSALQGEHERLQRAAAVAVAEVATSEALVSGDIQALARQTTELAAQATGVERASVWLFNDCETELRCLDLFEATPAKHSSGAVLRESEFRNEFRAFKTSRCVNADDALTDPRTAGYVEGYLKPLGITSMLDTIIGSAGRNLSLLCLQHVNRPHRWEQAEITLASQLADKLGLCIGNQQRSELERRVRQSLEQTVRSLTNTVEMRDPYTAGHQRRAAAIAAGIARELGFSEEHVRGLDLAASILDIGKITIPAEILAKPAPLSAVEYVLVKGHAEAGYEILKDVDFPWPVAEMIRQHHERMDGSGYPRGLKGEQILFDARILGVADVVEAISSHRPYRAAGGIDAALAEIGRGRGTLFDARVVDACVTLFRERGFRLPE